MSYSPLVSCDINWYDTFIDNDEQKDLFWCRQSRQGFAEKRILTVKVNPDWDGDIPAYYVTIYCMGYKPCQGFYIIHFINKPFIRATSQLEIINAFTGDTTTQTWDEFRLMILYELGYSDYDIQILKSLYYR